MTTATAQPPAARAAVLRAAADVLTARKDEVTGWLARARGDGARQVPGGDPGGPAGLLLPPLRLDAGMTHVNDSPANDDANTAFGGTKASGIGRFGGQWAVDEFTTDHWVSVQHTPRNFPV